MLQKIITLILVLSMLFGVSALTVSAASAIESSAGSQLESQSGSTEKNEENSGGSGSAEGELVTGWCDVAYSSERGEIVVTLSADKASLSNISKEQLKELVGLIVEAFKNVALDDILEDFGGIDIISDGLDSDNVWEKALDAYLDKTYPSATDKRMEFIKDALDPTLNSATGVSVGNERILDFANFLSDLLNAAVLIKPEIREILPDASGIDAFIEETLEGILNTEIDDYLHTIVDKYITYVKGGDIGSFSLDLIHKVEEYMHAIVKNEVGKYIENLLLLDQDDASAKLTDLVSHNEAMANDAIYKHLSDYVDDYLDDLKSEIPEFISAYVKAKLQGVPFVDTDGILEDIPDAETTIEKQINNHVTALIKTYVGNRLANVTPEAGSTDEFFKQFIDAFVSDAVNDIVGNYIYEKTGEGQSVTINGLNASLYSLIMAEVDEYFNATLDRNIAEYKAYMLKTSSVKPEFYDSIKAYVITVIMTEVGCTQSEAEDAYAEWENGNADYSDYLDDVTASNITLTRADFETALLGSKLDDVIDTVLSNLNVDSIAAGIDCNEIIEFVGSSSMGGTIDEKVAQVEALIGADDTDGIVSTITNLTPGELVKIIDNMLPGITAPDGTLTPSEEAELNNAMNSLAGKVVTYMDDSGVTVELVGELTVYAHDKLESGEFDDYIDEALGLDFEVGIAHVHSTMHNIAVTVADAYVETLESLDEALAGTLERISAILELIEDVSLDGESVFGTSANGAVFKLDAIIKTLNDLPKIEELATMSAAEMQLSYLVGIDTIFGDTEFTFTVKLGNGHDKVNKLFTVVDRYVDMIFDDATGNLIAVNVRIPEEFSKAILKACNTSKIPEDLKDRVFAAFSKNPEDLHALINNFALDDLIAILDKLDSKADFDNIITEQVVSRFENLDGLSYEQIKEKIEDYKGYFVKLTNYVSRIFSYLRQTVFKDDHEGAVFQLYDGYKEYGASFSVAFEKSVDFVDVIYNALLKVKPDKAESIALLVESLFDKTTLDFDIGLNVQVANIGKITYKVGNEIVREGFLPAGADIKHFAGITEYNGQYIVAWTDANGTPYSKMPAGDIVLHALLREVGAKVTVTDSVSGEQISEKIYDKNDVILTAALISPNPSATLSYQWYKNDVAINGATASTLRIVNVADSGQYKCVVTVKIGDFETKTEGYADVTIRACSIDLENAGIVWNGSGFVYGDKNIEVTLDESTIPEKVILVGSIYGDVTAVNVGTYLAKADFAIKDANPNYVFKNGVSTLKYEWSISKRQLGDDIVSFERDTVDTSYAYGVQHNITASITDEALREMFTVEAYGDQNSATNAGVYYAKVKLTLKDEYTANNEWVGSADGIVSYEWRIAKRDIDLSSSEYEWKAYDVTYSEEDGSEILTELEGFDFVYDGNEKRLLIVGLPEDVRAIITYTNAASTDATVFDAALVSSDGNGLVAEVKLDSTHADYETVMNNYEFATEVDSSTGVPVIKTPAPKSWKIEQREINTGNAKWPNYSVNAPIYNGNEVKVTLVGIPDDAGDLITYVYYAYDENGVLGITALDGAPVDAGKYRVVAKLVMGSNKNYKISEEINSFFDFEIEPKNIRFELSSDYDSENPFLYNGTEHTVTINGLYSLYHFINSGIVEIDYADSVLAATNAGKYNVSLTISIVGEANKRNYKLNGVATEDTYNLVWNIKKFVINENEVVRSFNTLDPFVYDGTEKTIEFAVYCDEGELFTADMFTITLLEGGVNSATNAGSYSFYTEIALKDEYKVNFDFETNQLLHTWTIQQKTVDISDIEWNYEAPFIYDGSVHTVTLTGLESILDYVTLSEYSDNSHSEIGSFLATVTVAPKNANYVLVGEDVLEDGTAVYTCAWRIERLTINVGELEWITVAPFVYDGSEKTGVPAIDLSGVDASILEKINVVYSGDLSGTNAGAYTVTVTITAKDEGTLVNYSLASHSCEWVIEKADYDMSEVRFEGKTVKYDGKEHSIYVSGKLPLGIEIRYVGNGVTEIGKHTVIAKFSGDTQNYNAIEDMVAILNIKDPTVPDVPGPDEPGPDEPGPEEPDVNTDHSFGDFVFITAENGLSPEYSLNVVDKTNTLTGIDLSGVFGSGKNAVLVVAYDIHFTKDGSESSVSDAFTVRLLLPEGSRAATKTLGIVYIKPDNTVEVIDQSLVSRDGDYIVFTTTHFSVYGVAEITDAPTEPVVPPTEPSEPDKDAKDYRWLLIIAAVIAIVIVIILLLTLIIKKKKNSKKPRTPKKPKKKTEEDYGIDPDDDLPAHIVPVTPVAQIAVVEKKKPKREKVKKEKKAKKVEEPKMEPIIEKEYDIEPEYADPIFVEEPKVEEALIVEEAPVVEETPEVEESVSSRAAFVAAFEEESEEEEAVEENEEETEVEEAQDIPAAEYKPAVILDPREGPRALVNPRLIIKHVAPPKVKTVAKPKPVINLIEIASVAPAAKNNVDASDNTVSNADEGTALALGGIGFTIPEETVAPQPIRIVARVDFDAIMLI